MCENSKLVQNGSLLVSQTFVLVGPLEQKMEKMLKIIEGMDERLKRLEKISQPDQTSGRKNEQENDVSSTDASQSESTSG